MNISTNATQFTDLPRSSRDAVENKLAPVARLLGNDAAAALLEIELAPAPAEGRSATPTKLVAVLKAGGTTYHAEAVKPTPESAADRVRRTLEAEVRRRLGKESAWKRGASKVKDWMRFGR